MLIGLALWFLQVGSPIVTPPVQSATQATTTNNITVMSPEPDAAKVAAMYQMTIAQDRHDIAAVPTGIATDLLQGENIWTHTPTGTLAQEPQRTVRHAARAVAVSLLTLAIVWTGIQIAIGSATGMGSMQLLLPQLFLGFFLAWHSELIALRSIELCNAINNIMTDTSLPTFTGEALVLPDRPALDPEIPGVIAVPVGFLAGLVTSTLYAIALIVLELKMLLRQGIIVVSTTLMPIAGALMAVGLTSGWGKRLFLLFFGWLFSQPLVVACLALSGSLLGLFQTDGPGTIFVKFAVLLIAISMASFFAVGASIGGGFFGLAGLMMLMRRTQSFARRAGGGGTATAPTPASPAASGRSGGTGGGTAASGRAWRGAYGAP